MPESQNNAANIDYVSSCTIILWGLNFFYELFTGLLHVPLVKKVEWINLCSISWVEKGKSKTPFFPHYSSWIKEKWWKTSIKFRLACSCKTELFFLLISDSFSSKIATLVDLLRREKGYWKILALFHFLKWEHDVTLMKSTLNLLWSSALSGEIARSCQKKAPLWELWIGSNNAYCACRRQETWMSPAWNVDEVIFSHLRRTMGSGATSNITEATQYAISFPFMRASLKKTTDIHICSFFVALICSGYSALNQMQSNGFHILQVVCPLPSQTSINCLFVMYKYQSSLATTQDNRVGTQSFEGFPNFLVPFWKLWEQWKWHLNSIKNRRYHRSLLKKLPVCHSQKFCQQLLPGMITRREFTFKETYTNNMKNIDLPLKYFPEWNFTLQGKFQLRDTSDDAQ